MEVSAVRTRQSERVGVGGRDTVIESPCLDKCMHSDSIPPAERVGVSGRAELAAANETLRQENRGLKEQLAAALQAKRRASGGDGAAASAAVAAAAAAVSHFCACIGSPCLRQCVHGASIGTAGVAGAEHAAHARRWRRRRRRGAAAGQRRARGAGRLARRRWGAAALGCAATHEPLRSPIVPSVYHHAKNRRRNEHKYRGVSATASVLIMKYYRVRWGATARVRCREDSR
eukprot:COSAG01_NODE_1134_length_11558_cov_8.381360_9_plen_231_part_00